MTKVAARKKVLMLGRSKLQIPAIEAVEKLDFLVYASITILKLSDFGFLIVRR